MYSKNLFELLYDFQSVKGDRTSLIYVTVIEYLLTSGVPQKVEVVPSGSTPSLHSPKSVSTT